MQYNMRKANKLCVTCNCNERAIGDEIYCYVHKVERSILRQAMVPVIEEYGFSVDTKGNKFSIKGLIRQGASEEKIREIKAKQNGLRTFFLSTQALLVSKEICRKDNPGNPHPEKVLRTSIVTKRDSAVVKFVLDRDRKCIIRGCFTSLCDEDGRQILVVHHPYGVENGDTADLAVAVCHHHHAAITYKAKGWESLNGECKIYLYKIKLDKCLDT